MVRKSWCNKFCSGAGGLACRSQSCHARPTRGYSSQRALGRVTPPGMLRSEASFDKVLFAAGQHPAPRGRLALRGGNVQVHGGRGSPLCTMLANKTMWHYFVWQHGLQLPQTCSHSGGLAGLLCKDWSGASPSTAAPRRGFEDVLDTVLSSRLLEALLRTMAAVASSCKAFLTQTESGVLACRRLQDGILCRLLSAGSGLTASSTSCALPTLVPQKGELRRKGLQSIYGKMSTSIAHLMAMSFLSQIHVLCKFPHCQL